VRVRFSRLLTLTVHGDRLIYVAMRLLRSGVTVGMAFKRPEESQVAGTDLAQLRADLCQLNGATDLTY
jgi:hypothetical protein